jgi:hypothetical protein
MAAVGRTLIIVVVVVLGLGAALYFLGPKTASRSQTLEIERPAQPFSPVYPRRRWARPLLKA